MSAKLVLTTPHLALFVARRNSGKSHLAKFLLYTLARAQRFKWVLVICNTSFTGDWGAIIGEENVLPVFDGEQLENLMERQAQLREEGVDNPGLVIMDDLIGAAHFASDVLTRLACAGRHYKITCWIACQHLFKLAPVLRTNSDYLFILGVQNERVLKDLWDTFGGLSFNDVKSLRAYALKATENFGAMCIDNTSAGAKGSPCRTVRAPAKLPQFRITQR